MAGDWLNCSAVVLMDRGDRELVESAAAASMAEEDYKQLQIEMARERAQVRK
jgi:hypothetical protein